MEIGRITFGLPESYSLAPMPSCKPPKKTAEEMLKKALEFANQGMDGNNDYLLGDILYTAGKYYAYEDMVAHLEMLIKEARR